MNPFGPQGDVSSDAIQRLLLGEGSVRAQIVNLSRSWLEIVNRHTLPRALVAELGKLTAAGVLLASALKFEGSLVLQIHGDGPVRLIVVESNAHGQFRATAKCREDAEIGDQSSLSDLVNAQGNGRFVVTLDPGRTDNNRQPYQGIVSLDDESVATTLEHYMERSEQVPTRIWLAADGQRASGLLLQRLPDDGGIHARSDSHAWERLVMLASTVTDSELLSLPPAELMRRLFGQEIARAIETRTCRFACSCTREKVAAMLRMLGVEEVDSILAEQNRVLVNCDFCNEPYVFDAVDCAQLFTSTPSLRGASGERH